VREGCSSSGPAALNPVKNPLVTVMLKFLPVLTPIWFEALAGAQIKFK
jgi:hypothetical protein